MNFSITIDWKFVVALGVSVSGIILAIKIKTDAAERVLIQAIDTGREALSCNDAY